MVRSMSTKRYPVIISEAAFEDLRDIDAKHHSMIRSSILERLSHEPFVETTNRKPRRPNLRGRNLWELRFGPNNRFRVLYRPTAHRSTVRIVAIGVKQGNKLIVRGEEF